MHNVFVYGSLMKGYWNHRYIETQKFIGNAELNCYEAYHVSTFPGIVKAEQGKVVGEVYEVDDDTLRRLDRLEGEGHMYIRKVENVIIEGNETKAFVYVWNYGVKHCRKVETMPWKPLKEMSLYEYKRAL